MSETEFKIDLTKPFETLANAPIVEAVIHWRTRPEEMPEPKEFHDSLIKSLPAYPHSQRQQQVALGASIREDGSSITQNKNWTGFRFESDDKRNVAQFTRDGFVFSRLSPYSSWTDFENEATRLWEIYCKLTAPSEIQRLGVRFINLIKPIRAEEVAELVTVPPRSPKGMKLPIRTFMHQSTFEIPGHAYNLNVIQTIPRPDPQTGDEDRFILDLDVFTTTEKVAIGDVDRRLSEMRFIKNEAFFSFLDQRLIGRFREQPK